MLQSILQICASSISFNQPLPLSPLVSPRWTPSWPRLPPRDDRAWATTDAPSSPIGRVRDSTRFSRRNSPEHLADEFVICSRKGKDVTGVPAPVPNPSPLPPPFTRPSLAQLVITLAICLSDRARTISSPSPHLCQPTIDPALSTDRCPCCWSNEPTIITQRRGRHCRSLP